MKNYLFAPFKDDEDKMSTWESCKSGIDQGIMIFLGRLESTYDAEICRLGEEHEYNEGIAWGNGKVQELKAENKLYEYHIKQKDKEIEELKAENYHDEIKDLHKERDDLFKENKRLKAENERLKKGFGHGVLVELEQVDSLKDEIESLKKENESLQDQLKECVSDYDNDIKASYELDDLKAENDGLLEESNLLKAEIKDLRKGCKLLKDTSHYPKEYKAEAEEYFEHNDHCKEVMFFMLDDTLFDDNDDFDDFINKDDAICVINNTEGSD